MNIDIKFNEKSEWFKTAEKIPNTNLLVEVKSDYLPNGKNYAVLVDTEHGTNWLYFGSDTNNEPKIIPFEYVSEWQWIEVEEMSSKLDEAITIISEHFTEASMGLFFCRNTVGDEIDNIYCKNGLQIDICYKRGYFEVFGLNSVQQLVLKEYYDFLVYDGFGQEDLK